MNKYRTHTCGELNISNRGQKIILSGWINKKRDHGNLLFIDLRDNYGLTQCVVDNENKVFKIKGSGKIDENITEVALKALNVDVNGLDEMDNKILTTLIDKFKGGPGGITTLATAVSENGETLEEVYEPFLIQEGFIVRTPRGREVTARAYSHLGRIKNNQEGLF